MEQSVSFESNGKILRGVIHTPDSAGLSHPAIILCHGFIGNKIGIHRIFVKAARNFCAAGYVVLRFDFSGCGDSDGDYSEITINGQVNETLAAIEFLRRSEYKTDRIFLVGHSMGGAVAALTSALMEDLTGLVMWAPVANMYDDILEIVGNKIFNSVWNNGVGEYMGFGLGAWFLRSLQKNHPLKAIKIYRGPVLIIHGTGDDEISPQNPFLYKENRKGLPYRTDIHMIPSADHTFSAVKWEDEVFNETIKWIRNPSMKKRLTIQETKVLTG